MHKASLIAGTLLAMLSVILGAFGAHYLKTIFTPEILSSFETGVKYQMYHGLALIGLGLFAQHATQSVKHIFIAIVLGVILFSGSIYTLCFLKSTMQIGLGGLGALTPIGGLFMIIGWLLWTFQIISLKSTKGNN